MTTLVDDPRADTAPPQTATWLTRGVAAMIDADPWAGIQTVPAPPPVETPNRNRITRLASIPAKTAAVPRRLRRWLPLAAMVVISLAWFVTLRPEQWGGPATYVVVRGISMEPTFHPGDVVITRRAPTYGTGDAVAYRVPAGEMGAGTIVIHRIIGGDAVDGFITRGDNNPEADDWHPRSSDVLGRASIRVPALGRLMVLLARPPGMAALAAVVAAVFALFPSTVIQTSRRRSGYTILSEESSTWCRGANRSSMKVIPG